METLLALSRSARRAARPQKVPVSKVERIRRWRRSRLANIARRRQEAWPAIEAREAARRAARDLRRAWGDRIADRMLAGMEPGGWYGRGDLIRFAGVGRYARGKVQQYLLARGYVERARNPEWRRLPAPSEIMAGAEVEPEFLYRLTARGEMERAALMMLE